MKQLILEGLKEMELSHLVPAEAPEMLEAYGRMLIEKNKVMNLTAITEPDQVARLHMLDCAALLPHLPQTGRLIDVGTGAGFPGMVLKILRPELDVTLLDSLNKRLDWLSEVADTLGLRGIRTVHARAEEQSHKPDFRDSFDVVTARAVASMELLSELCLPYAAVGGQVIAMKSVSSDQELSQTSAGIGMLGGQVVRSEDYRIPGTDVVHRLVLLQDRKSVV